MCVYLCVMSLLNLHKQRQTCRLLFAYFPLMRASTITDWSGRAHLTSVVGHRLSQTIAAMPSEARACWTGATSLGQHRAWGAGARRTPGQTKNASHLSTPPSLEGFSIPFCPQSDLFPTSGGVPWLFLGLLWLSSRGWKTLKRPWTCATARACCA